MTINTGYLNRLGARWRVAAAAFVLFAWNAYICLRLFTAEFHRHMNSVEECASTRHL